MCAGEAVRLVVLLALVPVVASAQFRPTYPGRTPQPPPAQVSSGGGSTFAPTLAWYGDSITQGACNGIPPPERLKALLGSNWFVANMGESGNTAAQIATRFFTGVGTGANPAAAVRWDLACGGAPCARYILWGGVNTFIREPATTPEAVRDTMFGMVDFLHAAGKQVVLFNVTPFRGWTLAPVNDASIDRVRAYNALVATECAARASWLSCVNVYAQTEDPTRASTESGRVPGGYVRGDLVCIGGDGKPDELHYNDAGAALFASDAKAALGL